MKELVCHKLCYSRPGHNGSEISILRDIDCRFPAGEITLIGGRTGAGKSTLLHILAGLARPTSGEVKADGQAVSRWVTAHKDLWRRKTGIVFQNPRFIRGVTALESAMLPLIPRKRTVSEVKRAAMESLERLRAVHLAEKAVHQLSGGERQRVGIAAALAGKPELLLADEPSSQQDDESTAFILDLFKEHARCGCLVVVVSHDHRILGSEAAKQTLFLSRGMLCKESGPGVPAFADARRA